MSCGASDTRGARKATRGPRKTELSAMIGLLFALFTIEDYTHKCEPLNIEAAPALLIRPKSAICTTNFSQKNT